MSAVLISMLMAVSALIAVAAIHDAVRKGAGAVRAITRDLAALDGPRPAAYFARPVMAAAARRPARRPAASLRAAA